MLKNLQTRIARHSLKLIAATLLLGVAGLAIASMGGEKRNRKSGNLDEFIPIRTSTGFTLKAGPAYKGSMIFHQEKTSNQISFNTLITYQKGNTTYIMPYNHRVNIGKTFTSCDNLQLLRLKVRMK